MRGERQIKNRSPTRLRFAWGKIAREGENGAVGETFLWRGDWTGLRGQNEEEERQVGKQM